MPDNMTLAKPETADAARLLRKVSIGYLSFLGAAMLLGTQIPQTWPLWLIFRLLIQQDVWLFAVLLVVGAFTLRPLWNTASIPDISARKLAAVMLAITLGCYAGFYWVLGGFDITRDEQMAAFDSYVFSRGQLVWPIPPEWQRDAKVLNTLFMLPVEYPGAWISAYLPGNAALRSLVGLVADPAFTGPLLVASSLPVMLSCARKLWPENREAWTVAVLLLLGSGQMLLSGMSSYAMPAHLFFNLVWMRLFLADRRMTDLAALAAGLIATGLHQPLFHPMFAAPFLLLLLLERRWGRLAIFVGGYALIGALWMAWPLLVLGLVTGPDSLVMASGSDYLTRLRDALAVNSDHLALTAANLLRFCTWQHALTVPLMLIGIITARGNRLVWALALGVLLPAVVMALILPYQGPGFGYRYLHGVIGNAVLLAGFGWIWLAARIEGMGPAFVRATLGTMLVLVPLQVWMAHERYAPFAAANRKISASGADYAVIQASNGISYGSLVTNRPDLSNRPVRLMAEYVSDHARLAQRICKPGVKVTMAGNAFFRPGSAYFGTLPQDTADARLPALRAPYERAGCEIVVLE